MGKIGQGKGYIYYSLPVIDTQQESSLEDYKQLSVMLQYNYRKSLSVMKR